jgi:hypothetical protein
LLLPAAGAESERHYRSSVERAVDRGRLHAWFKPDVAADIVSRAGDTLAAWGLRDNTRTLAGSGIQPIIWNRIDAGTLALFSNDEEFFARATVTGKGISEAASVELWESPDFRWIILLTDVSEVSIPLDVVRRGAGFAATYRINRQALVPQAWREDGLLEAISEHLGDSQDSIRADATAAAAVEWDLQPGDQINRAELHARFGGSGRGGMAPSRTSPNIFLFTDPAVGQRHGYYDGWVGELFHYTGMGQKGDQQMAAGNRALLNHSQDGRAVRLFRGVGGDVTWSSSSCSASASTA